MGQQWIEMAVRLDFAEGDISSLRIRKVRTHSKKPAGATASVKVLRDRATKGHGPK